MKKLATLIAIAALVTAFGLATTSSAAGPAITGVARTIQHASKLFEFSMSVHAIETANGTKKGNIQISVLNQPASEDDLVRAGVQCYGVTSDGTRAVIAGPAEAQLNPGGVFGWLVVAIEDNGTTGDIAGYDYWSWLMEDAVGFCEDPESFFRSTDILGTVLEGDFKIW
jgi:hypothetical protein